MPQRVHPKETSPTSHATTQSKNDTSLPPTSGKGCWPWCKPTKQIAPTITVRRHSLGQGGHSNVVSGEYGQDRQPIAVKLLSASDPHSRKELLAFQRLGGSHRNVVETLPHKASPRKSTIYLPMEMCDGSLLEAADMLRGLEEGEIAGILLDVLSGLDFMHSRGVFHLDVKPDNILLKDGIAKLADLGAAVLDGEEPVTMSPTHKPFGTPLYAPPESIASKLVNNTDRGHTRRRSLGESIPVEELAVLEDAITAVNATRFDPEKADVWSLGVTVFVTVIGVFPWGFATPRDASFKRWEETYAEEKEMLETLLGPGSSNAAAAAGVRLESGSRTISGMSSRRLSKLPSTAGGDERDVRRLDSTSASAPGACDATLDGVQLPGTPAITPSVTESPKPPAAPSLQATRTRSHSTRSRRASTTSIAMAMWGRVFPTRTQRGTPLTPVFVALLRGMLHPDPAQRSSVATVRAHPFFVRWEEEFSCRDGGQGVERASRADTATSVTVGSCV